MCSTVCASSERPNFFLRTYYDTLQYVNACTRLFPPVSISHPSFPIHIQLFPQDLSHSCIISHLLLLFLSAPYHMLYNLFPNFLTYSKILSPFFIFASFQVISNYLAGSEKSTHISLVLCHHIILPPLSLIISTVP
jgi:hypothetical protein